MIRTYVRSCVARSRIGREFTPPTSVFPRSVHNLFRYTANTDNVKERSARVWSRAFNHTALSAPRFHEKPELSASFPAGARAGLRDYRYFIYELDSLELAAIARRPRRAIRPCDLTRDFHGAMLRNDSPNTYTCTDTCAREGNFLISPSIYM